MALGAWIEVRIEKGLGGDTLFSTGLLQEALAEVGYEGFSEAEEGALLCYVPSLRYSESTLESLLGEFGVDVSWSARELPDTNWNAEWERSVEPVKLQGATRSLRVRAEFHAAEEGDLIVTPRMAFGTGHHATTSMVAEALLDADLEGRRVLDMGCGTGLLALVAARCGALAVDALDHDRDAVRNARENVKANGASRVVRVIAGGFDALPMGVRYDMIAANMTLNVLTLQMDLLASRLSPRGGVLAASGFLSDDAEALAASARRAGLREVRRCEREGWALCLFARGVAR